MWGGVLRGEGTPTDLSGLGHQTRMYRHNYLKLNKSQTKPNSPLFLVFSCSVMLNSLRPHGL